MLYLHNWIRLSTWNDQLFREYEVEDLLVQGEEQSINSISHSIDLSYESVATTATCTIFNSKCFSIL